MAAKKPAPKKEATAKKAVSAKPSSFVLEDGVEIPARTRTGASPYPFATMAVNQSFVVPAEVEEALYANKEEAAKALVEETRKIANRLSGATRRFTKNNSKSKFAVRTVDNGVRVWRTE